MSQNMSNMSQAEREREQGIYRKFGIVIYNTAMYENMKCSCIVEELGYIKGISYIEGLSYSDKKRCATKLMNGSDAEIYNLFLSHK